MVVPAAGSPAVVLCKEGKTPCGGAAYQAGTEFKAGQWVEGGTLVLHGSSAFSRCDSASMIGEISSAGGLGSPVVITLSTWSWSKSWESSECFGPAFSALKPGSLEIQKSEPGFTGWGVLRDTEITQGSCIYGAGEGAASVALFDYEVGGPAEEIGIEVTLPKISGIFCDSQKELTARYPVSSPTPIYVTSS